MILCRTNKRSSLDQHKDFIIRCLTEGKTQSETARLVMDLGCACGNGNVRQYVHSVAVQYQIDVNKYGKRLIFRYGRKKSPATF